MRVLSPPTPSRPSRPSSTTPSDPPALLALLGFHQSIRASLRSLEELAEVSTGGGVDGVRAATLHDFFRGPMRWHDDDESRSLLPRLLAADRSIAGALAACAGEHARMEAILDVVLVHLRDVGTGAAAPDAALLTKTAWQLRTVLEPHLRREELGLFPLARALLSPADFTAIASEVRVRRLRRLHHLAESDVLSW